MAGNRRDRGVRLAQQIGRQRQAPARQITGRPLADDLCETAGQRRPGDAHPDGQLIHRPPVRRIPVQQPQCRADHRIALGPVPGRGIGAGLRRPRPQHADQQQVQQPVQDHLLAQLLTADLRGEQGDQRGIGGPGRADQDRGQRPQQPSADLTRSLIGAAQHHRRPGILPYRPPRPHAQCHGIRHVLACRGAAPLVGAHRDLHRRIRGVGDRVRVGPPHHGHVPGTDPYRFGALTVGQQPRRAGHHRHHRQRGTVLDPQGPRRVEDRLQEKGAPGLGTLEKTGQHVHAHILPAPRRPGSRSGQPDQAVDPGGGPDHPTGCRDRVTAVARPGDVTRGRVRLRRTGGPTRRWPPPPGRTRRSPWPAAPAPPRPRGPGVRCARPGSG